jgi:hypothetical protein
MLIVVAILGKVLVGSMRVSTSQALQAETQTNVRTAGLVLPLEMREIGYDSNLTTGVVTSDILQLGVNSLAFRAMRGIGSTCGTPSATEIRIRKPVSGFRRPVLTDGFLLFVESDPNTGIDDQWIPLDVTAIDQNSLCGADSAIALTFPTPEVSPGVNLALSQVFVGGPVRYYERMQFGTMVDVDGETYLGARSLSLLQLLYRPVAGPLSPGNGLRFRYYDRAGAQLDPGTANPADVRVVELLLEGRTTSPVSLSGSSQRATGLASLQTRVALRNTLNH